MHFNNQTYEFGLIDDDGTFWDDELNLGVHKFKLKEEKQMLKFKEGQTYICTNTDKPWWTEGKEYEVKRRDDNFLFICDDDGDWYTQSNINNNLTQFKRKEEPNTPKFDLNKLTHEQLRIDCDLVEDVNEAQYSLDEFIKAHSK